MPFASVEMAIREVLPVIQAGEDLSEEETRRLVIDPVLRSLGWEPGYGRDNRDMACITEWYPYEGSGLRADYAMFDPSRRNVIVVEAKRLLEDTRGHYAQLAEYMEDGRDLVGVLTNGEYWNICRIDRRGRPSEENPIGLDSRSPAESARRLSDSLSKTIWHR